MSNTSSNKTSKTNKQTVKVIVGEIGRDTKTGILGRGYSYDNGATFHVTDTMFGRLYDKDDGERMWPNMAHKVADEIKSATADLPNVRKQADEAVKFAESAIAASKVNSDAIVAQSSAVVEAKSAMDSATAEIQQLKANAASDVAQIESTIAEVQAGVNQAKSANESAVQAVQAELKLTSDSMDKVEKRLDEVDTSLDTYAKSAAEQGHDITLIKQKQGQFEADFASAQGNVNQIQVDIKGLSQNIKDNQGNIASLLTSADKLQASMTDAEKNISNLLLTASKYEQTFKDQDGRLSKVEQTATEHTSELADAKGNIDKVTQKANTLQLLLSDAQKNIQNIQLDAKGLHDTLTGQGNQLASLDVTLNNLDSKYSGITGDLQSKQTALSTEQKQTKDMLLNKADKSEVDNVKGTVTQVSAEQKVMADQINQKVSSVEYQTLKDKVNGMKVSGRNLLIGTSEDELSGKAYAFADYQISGGLQPNKTYTLSGWARVDQNSLNHSQNVFVDAYSEDWSWSVSLNISSSLTSQYNKITFTTPSGKQLHPYVTVYLSHPDGGTNENNNDAISGMAFIKKLKLEEGDFDTDYTHAPEDTITAIQKNATAIDENSKLISLMAKQTEVDNVKNTAQQISSRLDILAGEVKSKVDETRVNNIVDGKGYATTSTVQSLVDQKAGTINESIANLTNKLVNNNGGGVNLISGTIEDIVVDDTTNTGTQGWCFNTIPINADLKVGDKITVSVENVTMTGKGDLSKWGATLYSKDISEARANNYEVNAGKNAQVTITVTSMNDPNKQTALLIYSGRVGDTEGKKAVFHHLKVERGEIATPYSQAPSDNATIIQFQSVTASIDGLQSSVTNYQNDTSSKYTQLSNLMQSKVGTADFDNLKRAVDMQTLDSADINNMRTNGHYFVRNLANNPIGGWVYVDVTGNGNDRIRQDVYQDSGLKHKYRRWFGTYWTGWEEGATYTEITQLQDAVNLRVQKGELLSQINLTAGNTLIQSNKLYLDASSVVFSGRAFIPSAAIASLSADKINTGTLNTDKISLSNGHVRLSSDDDHFYVQTEENAVNNPTTRFNFDGIDFMDSSYGKEVPQYSIGYDTSSADRHLYINTFDHFNSGGTTASQLWYSMVPAISLNNQEINFAAKGNMHMQVVDGGVNIKPTLFFQNNTNNGTYAGFTRLDNSDTVEFNTGNNNGENFHVNSGARFMKYVYFNDYCRAQGWLTYSTLSKKTNIKKLDTSLALDKIRQDDQYLYEYKRNVAKGVYDPQASFIIDDVNDVSHYSVPREFIDQTGKYREPSVELSYLIAAFQEIDKQVQKQKEEIKELKEKLQHE
ncbi:chromosome partitioning protein ParA [uncultured Limosilactobacillus sp.]|uniref:chromosome partitioning protein ParA n=1 Tax=uncultured Limosilactobacillus sp. TaxID=2837629 RepID=UPI0020A696FA|nr:chromosome partitioning protein ParA [uncultured Limosilactobacillus sp.]